MSAKMCCVFCRSAGKPESIWSSHWVKDAPGPKGKIVCPALLANECGYCHGIGHTPKFCKKLVARNKRREARSKPATNGLISRARSADGKRPTIISSSPYGGMLAAARPAGANISSRVATTADLEDMLASLHGPVHRPGTSGEGPKPVKPRPAKGAWAIKSTAGRPSLEVASLKAELDEMKRKLAEKTKALKEHLGEAFFAEAPAAEGPAEDTELAAIEAACVSALAGLKAQPEKYQQPQLKRQGAFGAEDVSSAPLPVASFAAVPLPDKCDMDRDLDGHDGRDGWDSD